MLVWLLVSLLPSYFLDKLANIQTRCEVGQKLGLGPLACDDEGEEWLKACKNGYPLELVDALLKKPKNSKILNKTDSDGNTGLHLAFQHNKLEVVKVFFQQSVIHMNVKNDQGLTSLDLARQVNSIDVLFFLFQNNSMLLKSEDKQRFENIEMNEDGSEYWKYIHKNSQDKFIKVNSRKIVESIKDDTLFPEDINNESEADLNLSVISDTLPELVAPEEQSFIVSVPTQDIMLDDEFVNCMI